MICDTKCKWFVKHISERVIICYRRGRTHPRSKKCNKYLVINNEAESTFSSQYN